MAHSQLIIQLFNEVGLKPEPEYRFNPTRKWRIDYALPAYRIAIEVEGGVFTNGRHTRGSGFVKDMEKYNDLALRGWRLLRFTPQDMLKQSTYDLIKQTALNTSTL